MAHVVYRNNFYNTVLPLFQIIMYFSKYIIFTIHVYKKTETSYLVLLFPRPMLLMTISLFVSVSMTGRYFLLLFCSLFMHANTRRGSLRQGVFHF